MIDLADDAQRELDAALPALDAALASLKNLSKNDVVEVRSLQNPPVGVKKVMEAACIMFDEKPKMKDDPDNMGKYTRCVSCVRLTVCLLTVSCPGPVRSRLAHMCVYANTELARLPLKTDLGLVLTVCVVRCCGVQARRFPTTGTPARNCSVMPTSSWTAC